MAQKSIAAKQHIGSETPITAEEKILLRMYRDISRWDRNCCFLILQSLAWGSLTPKTDKYSWAQISRITGLSNSRNAASKAG